MARYRIRVNGNGQFRVQSRSGLFWHTWCRSDHYLKDPTGPWGWHDTNSGITCDTSEEAVQRLLEAQAADDHARKQKQWVTVTEEKR